MLKKLFHFLGSIYLALILIAATALTTIAGTVLEAYTGSHLYASTYTYDSPLFCGLLLGFFINIFVSALRRFPFKYKHIPFLITHFGLLLIIAGQIVKQQYGTQGFLTLTEGKGSNEITLANSYGLLIEKKEKSQQPSSFIQQLPKVWQKGATLKNPPELQTLKISLLNFIPNVEEHLVSYTKDGYLALKGGSPIKIEHAPISPYFKSQILLAKKLWYVKALQTEEFENIAHQLYSQNIDLLVKESSTDKLIGQYPLQSLLKEGIQGPFGWLRGNLKLSQNAAHQTVEALISLEIKKGSQLEIIEIPLNGKNALINKNQQPWLGKNPLSFDLTAKPTLLFIQNNKQEMRLLGWSKNGEILYKLLLAREDSTCLAYEDGFQGYAQAIKIPMHSSRRKQERQKLGHLQEQLNALKALALPLQLLHASCLKSSLDFGSLTCELLSNWNDQGGWLYYPNQALSKSMQKAVRGIDWHVLPENVYKGAYCCAKLFEKLKLQTDKNLLTLLKENKYPKTLLHEVEGYSAKALWQKISNHMFAIANSYPETNINGSKSLEFQLAMLTAILRAYELHLSDLALDDSSIPKEIYWEMPIAALHIEQARNKKREDEKPAILLQLEYQKQKEKIWLAYDPYLNGLKWPVLDGKFLVRLQPMTAAIPHRLRLREARQILYPHSQQPYSYESDLLIYDNQHEIEKTLSMNTIYESQDGYRFYLANILPAQSAALGHVQIVVNRDPAKYTLTYPGCCLTTLGILLLFFLPQKFSTRQRKAKIKN